jgi:hypothetical protein
MLARDASSRSSPVNLTSFISFAHEKYIFAVETDVDVIFIMSKNPLEVEGGQQWLHD